MSFAVNAVNFPELTTVIHKPQYRLESDCDALLAYRVLCLVDVFVT